MPKDAEPSHVQREFTLAAIKAGIRTDGRKLTEARPWSLEWIGGEEGGLECRLGETWSVLHIHTHTQALYSLLLCHRSEL